MYHNIDSAEVFINNKLITVPLGYTVMQSCNAMSIDIPCFCYHDRLSIAGNCRMCLLEVSNSKKLIASCAVSVIDKIRIFTNSIRVKKARLAVLEFLLVNHPLDCPICDQGGECDLQDITMIFGNDRGRFYEYKKRAVEDKDFGPLIKTSMNRCIHCTRCVRFMREVSGSLSLGMVGRGYDSQISTYIIKYLDDELSGNIIDLCPVGALTSKPFAFKARSWELANVESIDIMDSLNSNIRLDILNDKVVRVLPRMNEIVNEEWLSNKARFCYDGFYSSRLISCKWKLSSFWAPYFVNLIPLESLFIKLSWLDSFGIILKHILSTNVSHIEGLCGVLVDLETVLSLKDLMNSIGCSNVSHLLCRAFTCADFNFFFLLNVNLSFLEDAPSICLLVGFNPRMESRILSLRMRRAFLDYSVSYFSLGLGLNYLSFPVNNVSNSINEIVKIAEFRSQFCKNVFASFKEVVPLILIGSSILNKSDNSAIFYALLSFIRRILFFSKGFYNFYRFKCLDIDLLSLIGVINLYSSRINFYSLGSNFHVNSFSVYDFLLHDKKVYTYSLFYLVGAEESDTNLFNRLHLQTLSKWIIYQGHNGSSLAMNADLLLPSTNYVEKNSVYFNLFGLFQQTKLATSAPSIVRDDWKIFRAFYDYICVKESLHYSFIERYNKVISLSFFKFIDYACFVYSNLTQLHKQAERFVPLNFLITRFFGFYDKEMLDSIFSVYRIIFFYSLRKFNFRLNFFFTSNLNFLFRLIFVNNYFIFNTSFSVIFTNYYTDGLNSILSSSKVMNVCSLDFLKRNNSFNLLLF